MIVPHVRNIGSPGSSLFHHVSTVGTDENNSHTVDIEMDTILLFDRGSPIDRLVELDSLLEKTLPRAWLSFLGFIRNVSVPKQPTDSYLCFCLASDGTRSLFGNCILLSFAHSASTAARHADWAEVWTHGRRGMEHL
jgi:hypothetical protein